MEDVIAKLEKEFGKEAPLTIHQGLTHDYLGMVLDFSVQGQVKVQMVDDMTKVLSDMPEDMDVESNTPAANPLFNVNNKADKLDELSMEVFHSTVARLLFLCKWAQPDIQTAIAFLCKVQ